VYGGHCSNPLNVIIWQDYFESLFSANRSGTLARRNQIHARMPHRFCIAERKMMLFVDPRASASLYRFVLAG
jgi:hypothetical protein